MIWEFLTWLANADMLGQMGLNIFSVAIFCVMFAAGTRKFYKTNNPFSFKKLPLIMASAGYSLAAYYFSLDRLSGWLYAFTLQPLPKSLALEVLTYAERPYITASIFLSIPVAVYFLGIKSKEINLRNWLIVLAMHAMWIIATIAIFNEYNMRYMSGDARTWFFLLDFIPMWVFWAYGYTRVLK